MKQINPAVRAFLDKVNSSSAPKINELPVMQARQAFQKMTQRTAPAPEQVGAVSDHLCANANGGVPLRLYVPVGKSGTACPAIVFVHGGGWVFGTINDYDSFCCALANRSECRVISIGYRLAPEHKFPAALQDVEHAVRWVCANAASLSIDPTRIGVVADSAGANVITAVAQSAQPPLTLDTFALIYPLTDLTMSHPSQSRFADGYLLTSATLQWFRRHYLPEGTSLLEPRLSPLHGPAIVGLRHALVITAGFDPLRDEGRAFVEKLRREGVEVVHKCYGDMIHGFLTMGALFDTADAALSQVAHWLRGKLNR